MKTKRKIAPFRISPFSCPKLSENQKKKDPHPDSASNFLRKLQREGRGMPQFCILFHANYTILATQRGGPWHQAPLNTPLMRSIENLKLQTIQTTTRRA